VPPSQDDRSADEFAAVLDRERGKCVQVGLHARGRDDPLGCRLAGLADEALEAAWAEQEQHPGRPGVDRAGVGHAAGAEDEVSGAGADRLLGDVEGQLAGQTMFLTPTTRGEFLSRAYCSADGG
jgi:hypothetical protein